MKEEKYMQIESIDHLVLTTKNLKACLYFYGDILGMKTTYQNDRYVLYFGKQKINIHTQKGEFQPAASNPSYGSLDMCFVVNEKIEDVQKEIEEKHYPIEQGIVKRHGARGDMHSIYLRDPDGNLIELCSYQ